MFRFLPGIALFQVIESVEDKINSSVVNAIPVFMIKDLRGLYQEMLRNLTASEEIIIDGNVTRLKEEVLKEVSALCEQRGGKFILLTLDAHVGKALFDVTQNSYKDDGLGLQRSYTNICLIKRRYSMETFQEKSKTILSHHQCFI